MSSTTTNLPTLPPYHQHTPLITSILGQNPGPFTLQGTNTYLVGSGPARILIDTAEGKHAYPDTLKSAMHAIGCKSIQEIIITHWHHDHTGGLQQLLDLFGPVKVSKYNTQLRGGAPDTLHYEPITATDNIKSSQTFKTDGATLTALCTPGHTSDHICLYLNEENVLFSGDCVLGDSTAIFSSLKPYMKSLQTIVDLKPDTLYSAHGSVIKDGVARVQMYIQHRLQREQQILDALNAANGKHVKAAELVKQIYDNLDERLIPAATNNVVLHLEKLVLDGKIGYESTDSTEITDDIDDSGGGGGDEAAKQKQRVMQRSEWSWFSKSGTSKQSSL